MKIMSDTAPLFQIERISPDSPLLAEVLRLHAVSKSSLGVFPKGAFEEAALRKWILVAIAPDKTVAGYVVFRVAKNRAAVIRRLILEQTRNGNAGGER